MHGCSLCLSGFISAFIYGVSALRWMASEPRYAFQLDDMNYWTVPHALSYLRSGFTPILMAVFWSFWIIPIIYMYALRQFNDLLKMFFIVFFLQTGRYNYFSNIGSYRRVSERKKRGNVSPRRPLTTTIKMDLRHS